MVSKLLLSGDSLSHLVLLYPPLQCSIRSNLQTNAAKQVLGTKKAEITLIILCESKHLINVNINTNNIHISIYKLLM